MSVWRQRPYVVLCKECFSIIATGKHRLLDCRCIIASKNQFCCLICLSLLQLFAFFFFKKKFQMQGGE